MTTSYDRGVVCLRQSGKTSARWQCCQHCVTQMPQSLLAGGRRMALQYMSTALSQSSPTTNTWGCGPRQYYRVRLKYMKYYKYIFSFYFDIVIINTFILYHQYGLTTSACKQHTLKKFCQDLAVKLIATYNGHKRLGRPSLHSCLPSPTGHMPPP